MLPQSAPLQREELLFSGLSRLAQLNALAETRGALARLTGGRNYCVSADLPCHLAGIVRLAGPSLSVTDADTLIERHTLFPFYRRFMPEARWPRIREIALSHEASRLKGSMGILAHGIRATPILRYCPVCLRAGPRELGGLAWIRGHHLPGVMACPHHGCLLVATLSQADQGHRARLWLPPLYPIADTIVASPAQCVLSRISLDALHYEGPHIDSCHMGAAYEAEVRRRDWTRPKGLLDFRPLEHALRSQLGSYLNRHIAGRFGLRANGALPWLRDLIWPRARFCSPLAHVMLIQILFGSFDRFLEACQASNPTAQPSEPVIPEPSRFEMAATAIVNTSLSCRQVAASWNVSIGWVVKQRRAARLPIRERRKTLDEQRVNATLRLLRDGLPVAVVAQQCKLSVSSVYRIQAIDPSLLGTRADRALQSQREVRRSEWSGVVSTNPALGTKELRRLAAACYAWLYRCDRQWLVEHCPQRRPARATQRVNWEQRDAALAQQLAAFEPTCEPASHRLRSPVGAVALVYPVSSMTRHADKLPKLTEVARSRATD